jgi:hypothetical protein
MMNRLRESVGAFFAKSKSTFAKQRSPLQEEGPAASSSLLNADDYSNLSNLNGNGGGYGKSATSGNAGNMRTTRAKARGDGGRGDAFESTPWLSFRIFQFLMDIIILGLLIRLVTTSFYRGTAPKYVSFK